VNFLHKNAFTIIYNVVLVGASIFLAVKTVSIVLKLRGSMTRRVITAVVLFLTVLGWVGTAVLGAFDDFDFPLIKDVIYMRLMQVTLLLIVALFYLYASKPPETEKSGKEPSK
jgi:hypothetical protein